MTFIIINRKEDMDIMKKTIIGGQALIEGLMMIGPQNLAIAIRKPNDEIIVEKKPLPPKNNLLRIPILRGSIFYFRQMVLGFKALMFSIEFVEFENPKQNEPTKFDKFIEC